MLGSGSAGNSALIATDHCKILVDGGLSARQLVLRLAQCGVTYTVLAPWQAATPIDPTEPYIIPLQSGRRMTVFFYNAPLSGGVSFDENTTSDANIFGASYLPSQLMHDKRVAGEAQLILIATDGELYGHHKPWRDQFLTHLLHYGAPGSGFEVCSLERYMALHPATKEVSLRVPSASLSVCASIKANWKARVCAPASPGSRRKC